MKVEMLMPQMGESITEATILKWRKNVGEEVKKDEIILEISTDKVDSEIPSPAAGVIAEVLAQAGQTVAVKSIVAIIETDKVSAVASSAAPAKPAPAAEAPVPKTAPQAQASSPPVESAPISAATNGGSKPQRSSNKTTLKSPYADDTREFGVGVSQIIAPVASQVGDRFYSPLVRNMAAHHGLSQSELGHIPGSGAHGRVTKSDVQTYLDTRSSAGSAEAQKETKRAPGNDESVVRPQYGDDGRFVIPFDNMRKRIAEHMVRSKATSPHVYTVAEADITTLSKWRNKVQAEFTARENGKLSFTPFFLEAAVKALMKFPQVNASVEGESLVLKKAVNLGCAVAIGNTGLIVPVIKNADQLTLTGLARSLADLATKARDKKLLPDDIQGGTFTVTNPGTFGSIIGYPIINQPQLAILGVGAIKKRPAVINDAIAIRDIVYLTLSYDHRVIDGSLGGQFLNFIATYLENWDYNRTI